MSWKSIIATVAASGLVAAGLCLLTTQKVEASKYTKFLRTITFPGQGQGTGGGGGTGAFAFNSAGSNGASSFAVGMNSAVFAYYINAPMMADVLNQSSANFGSWQNQANSATVALDTTGGPTAAAQTLFTASYPTGTYTLSYTGSGTTASLFQNAGCTWTLGSPTINGNTVSYPVNVVQDLDTSPTGAGQLFCTLNLSGPASNVHLMAPASMTTGDFMTGYLMKLAPFNPIRWLDPLTINFGPTGTDIGKNADASGGNGTQNWLDRTFPFGSGVANTGSGGAAGQGIPYDYIIEYANITGKDVWIQVPDLVTDNYMCRLGRLLAFGESGTGDNGSNCSLTAARTGPFSVIVPNGINTTSHVIIEYANETWNSAFPAFNNIFCWTNAAPQSGGTCPDGTGAPPSTIGASKLPAILATSLSTYARAQAETAELAKRCGDLVKQVFNNGGRSFSQIITVMNIQAADPTGDAGGGPGLNYIQAEYGTSDFGGFGVDQMAVAPYIQPNNESGDCLSGTVATCVSDLTSSESPGGQTYGWVTSDLAQANQNGIKLRSYEGGSANWSQGPTSNWSTIARDPSTFAVWSFEFTGMWGAQVGHTQPLTWFQLCSNEMWGALINCPDHGSQRWDAMLTNILIPGDANYDGKVDISDCDIVLFNQGKTTGQFWEDGDFNHDGGVGSDDLTILNQHFPGGNCGSGQGTATIPTNSLQNFQF